MISRNVILSEDRLARVVKHFMGQPGFSYDLETTGVARGNPAVNTVVWLSMATDGACVSIPFGHPLGDRIIGEAREPRVDRNGKTRMFRVPVYEKPPEQLDIGRAMEILQPLFWAEDIFKVNHETTFDRGSLAKYFGGVIPPGYYHDTKVIEWLLNENHPQQGLKYHVKRLYGVDYDREDVGKCVEKHPFSKVAHYAYMDAFYTWMLFRDEFPKLKRSGVLDVYEQIEQPLFYDLAEARLLGAHVSVPKLKELRETLTVRSVREEADVYKAAGQKFNLNSAPQKQKILYGPAREGGQGLKPWKLTDTAREKKKQAEKRGKKFVPEITSWSTDADALKTYAGNPVVDALLAYQDTTKILGTYVNSYLGVEGDKKKPCQIFNSRIYAEAQQHGARTGRFSYRAPNLQNLPRYDEAGDSAGGLIRSVFDAAPGELLVFADYGQIELVILAHYLGKGHFYEGFFKGIDPHTMTAATALGKDPGRVTKDERQDFGKSINFAVTFGAGAKKVASMMGVSEKRAREFLNDFYEAAPEIEQFRRRVIREAKKRRPPHVRTIGGRMRRVPEVFSSDDGIRMGAERQLFNTLMQGGSADLTKAAIVEANRLFRENNTGAHVILTVHDELGCTSPEENAGKVKVLLEQAMTQNFIAKKIRVPITADAGIGKTWAAAKI